jgi:hypothetical protein
VFFDEVINQEVFVYASGSTVNLPDAGPERPHWFVGTGPHEDRPPDSAEVIAIFVNSTFDFNLKWTDQTGNLLQSSSSTGQITLTSTPGDTVPLLIVMKLFWYCEDVCQDNKAPILVSHSANQIIYAPVDNTFVLRLKFEDDVHNNHGTWKVWMGEVHLDGEWTGVSHTIDIKMGDHFTIVEGLEVIVQADSYDDCGAKGGYDVTVKFTDNPPNTSDTPTTTKDDSSNVTITTSPGFELFVLLFGLAVIGITARRRN